MVGNAGAPPKEKKIVPNAIAKVRTSTYHKKNYVYRRGLVHRYYDTVSTRCETMD